MKNFDNEVFENEYKDALNNSSHINEHLPILRDLAKQCKHITEMGVHEGISTRAFLCEDVVLRCYDLTHYPRITELIKIAKESGKDVEYFKADVLEVDIEKTDLLFIDTWHVYEQLKQELELHASKVKKYLVFHDTQTFGTSGHDTSMTSHYNGKVGTLGLLPAIIEFVIEHPEWKFKIHKTNNNGLTVLEKAK
jgi:hypothetical protein